MSAKSVPFFVKKLLKHSHRVGVSEKSLRVVQQIFLTLSKRTHNSAYEFPHREEKYPRTPHPVVHSGDFGRVGVWTFQCRLRARSSQPRVHTSVRFSLQGEIHLRIQRCQTCQQQMWHPSKEVKVNPQQRRTRWLGETRCEHVIIWSRRSWMCSAENRRQRVESDKVICHGTERSFLHYFSN